MYALNTLGLNLDLLTHLVVAHLARLRSMWGKSMNVWRLDIWGYGLWFVVCKCCW